MLFAFVAGVGLVTVGLWMMHGPGIALVFAGLAVCVDLWLGAILNRKGSA